MIEIEWTDTDPQTGERRYLEAIRFGHEWRFRMRLHRRGEWTAVEQATREMWEHVLDALRRRQQRRDRVTELDVKAVETILAGWRERPSL